MSVSATHPPRTAPAIMFSGRRRDLARLALANSLLTLLTLGIYRFWARTRIRRFYWQSIEIAGDPLEYTGRGLELFLGFLIVLAVFLPIAIAFSALQNFLAFDAPEYAVAAQLALFVLLWWLIGYAVYRARRYRLTRTLWRGIRCGQDGSAMRYAWTRFGWTLAAIVTLGVAVPWYHVALRRFEMRHTCFGFSRFAYAGRGRDLFGFWWPVLVSMLVAIAGVVLFGVGAERIEAAGGGMESPGAGQATVPFAEIGRSVPALGGLAVALVGMLLYFLAQARYRVESLRYLFAVSSVAGATCRSNVRLWRVVVYGLILLAMLVLSGVAVAAFFAASVFGAATGQAAGLGVLLIPFVIAVLLFLSIAQQVFFQFPLVRHVVSTLELADVAALDGIVQATREDPRFGEGLLDALEIELDVA
jgi:uncharacterized membrane protein YjgN (DUF898 family)